MNRSILIVICDFLLVSLLTFSTVDINKVGQESAQRTVRLDIPTNQVPDSAQDLNSVMKLALEEERKNRDQLMGELTKTREDAAKQQSLLSEREKGTLNLQQELKTREAELQARQQENQKLQQQQSILQQQQSTLQEQQANLQEQYAAAQTNLLALNQRLQNSTAEAIMSKEKLAQMEAEAKKRTEESAALQQQLSELAKSNQFVLNERQKLAGQLQVTEAEKRAATEQAARLEQDVKVEREEKAKLAEGVKVLASRSGELTQEIRENRPLAPNTIFNEFVANRVAADFIAFRSGFLGSNKRKDTETILVSDGTNTYALCHVSDTPLTLFNPGTDWDALSGALSRNGKQVQIHNISFYIQDPRLIYIPLKPEEVKELGAKVYSISSDPFKFQDAVLVGAREGYYGECKFQIDLSTPEYVKLDNSFIKGLFGKFNPSRGDLVFSKTGEFLGVMANNTYCLMIKSFYSAGTFHFGQDIRSQHTGETLSRLYMRVFDMPVKLQ
jgi:hypothetical protein